MTMTIIHPPSFRSVDGQLTSGYPRLPDYHPSTRCIHIPAAYPLLQYTDVMSVCNDSKEIEQMRTLSCCHCDAQYDHNMNPPYHLILVIHLNPPSHLNPQPILTLNHPHLNPPSDGQSQRGRIRCGFSCHQSFSGLRHQLVGI